MLLDESCFRTEVKYHDESSQLSIHLHDRIGKEIHNQPVHCLLALGGVRSANQPVQPSNYYDNGRKVSRCQVKNKNRAEHQ